jgi:RimJ/RimL family protein N-acetyltransferase
MAAALPDPVIRVDDVSLRRWQAADADALFDAFRDREILRFSWPSVSDYRLDDAETYLRDQEAGRLAGNQIELAAVDRHGRTLGGFSLYRIDQATRTAAVGYWLVAAARGRGLATAIVHRLALWGFERLGIERLKLTCGPENHASQTLAHRVGFQREGLLRQALPFKGSRRDTVIFGLLPGDLTRPAPS